MIEITGTDTLQLREDDSYAEIVPSRGAIVTKLAVDGRELLYLDESTLRDPSKNVRGGVPLLFPSPGKLDKDTYARAGRPLTLKQHGFARDLPWTVAETGTTDAAYAKLTLASSDRTREVYPWEFALTATLSLRHGRLRIAMHVANTGAEPLPFGFGAHPYFLVKDKAQAHIPTRATRAFDNVSKREVPFEGFDLTAPEVDLHLVDHDAREATLAMGDGGAITVRACAELSRWVIWTVAGKDFVCVEPWSAPGNALNTGDGLIVLPPGASRDLWLEIDYAAP